MSKLANQHCIPCSLGTPPLSQEEIKEYYNQLEGGWTVTENNRLEKSYRFRDFTEALKFTNKVAKLAEKEGHHPDIYLSWAKVRITLYTHKINGLSEADFVLAAKIDEL
ncbi:4a-hydroxytetrahydrobiopterin dehydratase [Alkaliphilus pronyensis]|uniref:Putative pterin-4-alpha-carbinolamine dehydratase n=1 Tax=Alkaliphilus pronyensis TaxID=1482732 RepID=A0A6I0FAU0_9FIRM|nr:4a-hydroxytetrahydrobiopterin dehydratase [Alkaliphilus pronyensis]KAB3534795.1 4a-hydroxytetrahydrobiopterin dehydratase [Alkaliphilus pronyensis]